ncbi:ATP-binding protein [Pedococcus sp. KACC 23699]|uniref:histidine kinase n=1 Tax=Pedococcus sp. KACC 23699 TaxID=3149228 RepID=A0AAU7JUG6_9MICO
MLATGVAWGAGALGDLALFWHRGPLIHLFLAYPSGRLRWRLRAVVVVAYVLALAEPVDLHPGIGAALAGVVVTAAVVSIRPSPRTARAGRILAVAACGTYGIGLGASSLLRDHLASGQPTALAVYDGAVVASLLLLAVGHLWLFWSRSTVSGLAVELGSVDSPGTVAVALRRAFGDQSARLFFWMPVEEHFVDEQGLVREPPVAGPENGVTLLQRGGQPVGVIVHDPALVDDAALLDQVASLASLALANVQLRAQAQGQLRALQASRRRIVSAAAAEQLALGAQLEQGPQRRLAEVARLLEGHEQVSTALSPYVDSARASLHEFANGIGPATLGRAGLAEALDEVARAFPVDVEVRVALGRLRPEVEALAYFVCSEALTNAGKYAAATRIGVTAGRVGDIVTVSIRDDGVGGADESAGSGIRGLRDRVEALGGELELHSPVGVGTELTVSLPV